MTLWVDDQQLIANIGDDPALIAELVDTFADDSLQVGQQLAAACDAGQLNDIMYLAHRLKGSLLTLGAAHAGQLAGRCEHIARQEDPTAIALAKELLDTLQPTRDALQQSAARLQR